MATLAVIVLGVHIVGAAIWVGSSVLLGVIAAAVHKALVDYKVLYSRVMSQVARTVGWVMWGALVVTIGTGLWNLSWYLPNPTVKSILSDAPLALKLILVFFLILTSAIHSFVLGPMVRRRQEGGVKGMGMVYLRITDRTVSVLSVLLSMAVIFAAVVLAQGG